MFLPKATGKDLTNIGLVFGVKRRWYERIWSIGNHFFRCRILECLRKKAE